MSGVRALGDEGAHESLQAYGLYRDMLTLLFHSVQIRRHAGKRGMLFGGAIQVMLANKR